MNQSKPDDRISKSLTAAHSAVNARHKQTRTSLLECLSDGTPLHNQVQQSAAAWRYVVGGLGLSAIASTVLLVLWLLGPTPPAVAMERMATALDQVISYSFRMESVYVSRKVQGRTVRQVTVGHWRTEPVGLQATMHIVETLDTNTAAPGAPKTLVDLEETHQAGRRGIIIDHLTKQYWWIDEELDAKSIGNPQVVIYMVRQRRGRVLRDLGEKKIDGRVSRGLEIILDDAQRASELGPTSVEDNEGQAAAWEWRNVKIEVWLDPKTDLPIEFRCARRGDDFETTCRFTDLKWNVEFAVDAFDAVAPDGYKELEEAPWAEEE